MSGKSSKTTTPGRGYTDAVTRSRGLTDSSGRGVPDERRTSSENREGPFAGSAADPGHAPPGLETGAASGSEDADTESDEAPSGRVQGG